MLDVHVLCEAVVPKKVSRGITARTYPSEEEYLGEAVCAKAENLPISR